MIIAIDLSLRSSGIVSLDDNKKLVDFKIIKSKPNSLKANKNKPWPELNEEELLMYNSKEIVSFVEKSMENYILEGIVVEGLSFGSKSSSKDLIAGNSWVVTVDLKRKFPEIPLGRINVATWRSPLVTKEEKKEYKEKYKTKGIKKLMVDKLPMDIYIEFNEYIIANKMDKDSIFDLTDAYFLGLHRLSLN